jgi:2-oxoisovalerate dehydrogenase E1 component subunit alpha
MTDAEVPVEPAAQEAPHRALGLSDQLLLRQYELMLLARRISEQTLSLALQGRIAIAIPCDGHEAAQVGSVLALRSQDLLHVYHRSLAVALARGLGPVDIFLEHFARAAGPCSGGRHMPGHWGSRELRMITPSSCVATQLPTAVGTALASKVRRLDEVSIVYFGDGATSKGDFHEALNFASVWQLPVIFFCENNNYAISVPFEKQSATPSVAARAAAYNLPGLSVDGMDLLAVYRATREAHQRARQGGGPTLIEARVYRFSLHTSQVGDERYREQAEIAAARSRDPLTVLQSYLERQTVLAEDSLRELRAQVERTVEEALWVAEASPLPDAATACQHVLAP